MKRDRGEDEKERERKRVGDNRDHTWKRKYIKWNGEKKKKTESYCAERTGCERGAHVRVFGAVYGISIDTPFEFVNIIVDCFLMYTPRSRHNQPIAWNQFEAYKPFDHSSNRPHSIRFTRTFFCLCVCVYGSKTQAIKVNTLCIRFRRLAFRTSPLHLFMRANN